MLQRTIVRLNPVPSLRCSVRRIASVAGLAAYAERFRSVMPRRTHGATTWPLPVVAFGLDDVGSSAPDRAGRLFAAMTRKGCNFVWVDGDAMLQRQDERSEHFSPRVFDRAWEASTLRRLFSPPAGAAGPAGRRGLVDRSEVVIGVRLALGRVSGGLLSAAKPAAGVGGAPPPPPPELIVRAPDVAARLATACALLDVPAADVLLLHVPASTVAFARSDIAETVAVAEALVAAGTIQSYGFACDRWLPGPARTVAVPADSAAAPIGQPLVNFFEEAAAATAARGGHSSTGVRHRAALERQQRQQSARPPPSSSSNLGFIAFPASLSTAGPHFLSPSSGQVPARKDVPARDPSDVEDGKSVVQVAHEHGASTLLLKPLDALLPVAAAVAGKQSQTAAPSPATAILMRPFRCIPSPVHAQSHPSRSAALVNDILNFAIHCEIVWEREIRAAVQVSELLAQAAKAEAAPPAAAAGEGVPFLRSDSMTDVSSSPPLPLSISPAVASLDSGDVAWARVLASRLGQYLSRRGVGGVAAGPPFTLLEWHRLKARHILPALSRLARTVAACADAQQWMHAYRLLMTQLLARMDIIVEQEHAVAAAAAATHLRRALPELGRAAGPFAALLDAAPAGGRDPNGSGAAAEAMSAEALGEIVDDAGSSLASDTLRCLLSAPGSIAVTEEGGAFGLHKTKRVAVPSTAAAEKTEDAVLSGEDGSTGDLQQGDSGSSVSAVLGMDPLSLVLPSFQNVQRAIADTLPAHLHAALTSPPGASWRDPLEGVPTQAELQPLRDAMRTMTSRIR